LFKSKLMLMFVILLALLTIGVMGCEPEEEVDPEPEPDEEEPEEPEVEVGFREITGIDPGAGIMSSTEEAVEVYDLELPLTEGSDAAMTAELSTAIGEDEWIVVTGWAPHWKLAEWDLKFLEDPELVYGGEEYIATIARQGLADDLPEVYAFLEEFYWGDEEIGVVMEMNMEDDDFLANAETWMEDNSDLVEGWLPDDFGEEANGQEVEIQLVEWECALATSYVVKAILQDAGYEVDLTSVDAGVMWSAAAAGDIDFFVCAWLPGTHEAYYEDYGDDIDEIRANYEGAQIGLVVPEYVDIDCITEINDHILD